MLTGSSMRTSADSNTSRVPNFNPAGFDGFDQTSVVGFGLVGILHCEFYDGVVERGVRSHITGNHRRVAGARMRSGESPCARFGKIGEDSRVCRVERHPYFHVAQLANVEMPTGFQSDGPAEE